MWNAKGVPFQTFMYVPEVHPLSHKEFHEREDEGHVFKVYRCIIKLHVPKLEMHCHR